MEKEKRVGRVIFNKSGGNSSKNSFTHKLNIPSTWVKEMGVTQDDREVVLKFENGIITIEKFKEEKE